MQNLLSQLMYTHLTHIFEDSVVVFSVAEALFGFWCNANDGGEKFVPPDAALHLSAPGSVSHLCLSCSPLPLSSFSLEHLCPQGVRLSCATACYPLWYTHLKTCGYITPANCAQKSIFPPLSDDLVTIYIFILDGK